MDILAELDIDPTLCVATMLNAYNLVDILEPNKKDLTIFYSAFCGVPFYMETILGDGKYMDKDEEGCYIIIENHTLVKYEDYNTIIELSGWNYEEVKTVMVDYERCLYCVFKPGPIYKHSKKDINGVVIKSRYINDPKNIHSRFHHKEIIYGIYLAY